MDSDTVSVTLATVAVVAVVYEWVAVKFRRVPTITEVIKAGGWPARLFVAAAGSLALIDHFATGWVL